MPHVVALSLAGSTASTTTGTPPRLHLPTSSSTPSLSALVAAYGRPGTSSNGVGIMPLSSLGKAMFASTSSTTGSGTGTSVGTTGVKAPMLRLPTVHMACVDKDVEITTREARLATEDARRKRSLLRTKHKGTVDKTNPFIGYFTQSDGKTVARRGAVAMPRSQLPVIPEQEQQRSWRDRKPKLLQVWKATATSNKVCENDESTQWLGAESQAHSVSSTSSQDTVSVDTSLSRTAPNSSVGLQMPSRFEQDFRVIGSIGEGGQGSVFKVQSRLDGGVYAIKKVVLPKTVRRESSVLHQALREVTAMALMPCHPHVVRYHTAWLEEIDDSAENGSSEYEATRDPVCQPTIEETTNTINADFQSFRDDQSIASFSSFEGSMGGFEFAESSVSRTSGIDADDEQKKPVTTTHLAAVQEESLDDDSVSISSQSYQRDTILVLYIQMELCRMPMSPSDNERDRAQDGELGDSFHRLIDRVNHKAEAPVTPPSRPKRDRAMVHPSFSSWLRGSVDMRSDPETAMRKHKEGLKLYLGILDGVQHMHKCGVIHRDLKPENVFLHGNTAKIGDFGLSKSILSECEDSVLASKLKFGNLPCDEVHTTALGTFTYASPEQLGNLGLENDHRVMKLARYSIKSDIFALGVILLELCCPCKTMMERSQVLTAVRHGVVPQRSVQQYPVEMGLVLRMTAVDPVERPSAEEVIEQLQPLVYQGETPLSAQAVLADLRDLQQRFAIATHQLRDRPQSAQQFEALASELQEKVQALSLALMP